MMHHRREAVPRRQPYLMMRADAGNGSAEQHVPEPQATAVSHQLPKTTIVVVTILVVLGLLLIGGEHKPVLLR